MGEILGIGVTHYPQLAHGDEYMSGALRRVLRDPGLPEEYRDPNNWSEALRREYGSDDGKATAQRHRQELVTQFRKTRNIIDEFAPDFIVIWGDDQYENFKEDVVPPFAVLAYDQFEVRPWQHRSFFGPNVWGEPDDKTFVYKGHRAGAKRLAAGLIESGFDVAYAYQPLHQDLGHAFLNPALYLDYDRQGFDHAMVPVAVNCYGRRLISQTGGLPDLTNPAMEGQLDPPSAQPWRCFDLGAATARVLANSPYRVVLMASSSWSHAFLSPRTHWIEPDVEADRRLYDALAAGDYQVWRNTPLSSIEASGQQEMLNWMCLMGAMEELGRKPDESIFIENHALASNKCFAVWRP
jgi:hypothetical protein